MENDEEKNSSKLSLWGSIIWTFAWIIAAFIVFIAAIYSFVNSGFQEMESLIFAVGSFVFLSYTLIVDIKKIKELRKMYYSSDTSAQSLVADNLLYGRGFYERYRRLSIMRILCICIFPFLLLGVVAGFLFLVYGHGWESLYMTIYLLVPALVLVLWLSLGISRNLRLLKEVYECADSEERTQLNHIAVREFTFIFTKTHFLNWDGALHVIRLEDIKQIRYKKYFWGVVGGMKLVIMDSFGRKYTIMEYGPPVEEWDKHGLLHYVVKGHKDGKVYREVHIM